MSRKFHSAVSKSVRVGATVAAALVISGSSMLAVNAFAADNEPAAPSAALSGGEIPGSVEHLVAEVSEIPGHVVHTPRPVNGWQ
ncbi:hypothetical protein [Streptomyces sp. NEAU-W12]|uniref:hypothetical protein n=1 Tax=Streptomyces sp. NEAU-W12 TaxID=2994668 RepID=UPI00224AF294|nr:hypothetical protein [Streptomyces sp. NEAU-W12]MCX2928594.1 hypothetical protein [Streptomyces sp. NEAU-W12]